MPADKMRLDDPNFTTIEALQAAYRQRSLSPVEVMQSLLDKVDAHNSVWHAYIDVLHASAMACARASEARYMSGLPVVCLREYRLRSRIC